MTQVSATSWFDFAVDLTGVYDKGQRATHNDPGYEASVEDAAVSGLRYERPAWVKGPAGFERKEVSFDLLDGVDVTDPNVVKLLNNIADALGDHATDALADNL